MDWTLVIIGTLTALLVVIALHLIWKEKSHTPSVRGEHLYQSIEKGFVPDACRHLPQSSHRNGSRVA
jgi:hypothetical protein